MKRDKLYLVGFVAAGKSTLARALAGRLDWRSADIDDMIEAREHRSISEIFATRGEPYFRSVEREVLRLLLPPRHLVVATGGGTFAEGDNRAAITADGTAVWLDIPVDRVVERLNPGHHRPLAQDRATFEAFYLARRAAYQHAHLRIDATRPVQEQVEIVLDLLGF